PKKLEKIGNLSSDTALLYFEDCRIPTRFLLGEENEGFYHIMTNFQGERLVASIGAVSGMQHLVEEALRYGNERSAFGKPLAKFQVWRHRFVEHLTSIEAARWLTYRACDLFNRKEPAVKEISMAKLFAGGVSWGRAGPYEKLFGTAYMEVDPRDPLNARIVDLDRAPRNARGMVEFSTPFFILKPVNMAAGNGKSFYTVNNRGGPLAIDFGHPLMFAQTAADVGDNDIALNMGFTV